MKKIIKILYLLLVTSSSIAQQNTGIITYKKDINKYLSETESFQIYKEKDLSYYNTIVEIDNKVKKIINEIPFKLKFNKLESIFKAELPLELENDSSIDWAIGPDGSDIHYLNLNKNLHLVQRDAYGELFLIHYPIINWTITNKSKEISTYTCFLATATLKIKGRNGLSTREIEAWFSPDIVIPFGPLGFGNLPGLILELSFLDFKYSVSKIELNPKGQVIIEKPIKGKKVTKDQFEEIGLEMIQSFKKGF